MELGYLVAEQSPDRTWYKPIKMFKSKKKALLYAEKLQNEDNILKEKTGLELEVVWNLIEYDVTDEEEDN